MLCVLMIVIVVRRYLSVYSVSANCLTLGNSVPMYIGLSLSAKSSTCMTDRGNGWADIDKIWQTGPY